MREIQRPRVSYKAAGKPQPVFDNDTGRCIGHIMPSVHPDVLRASPGIQNWSQPDSGPDFADGPEFEGYEDRIQKTCYQCEQPVDYLFDDSRCQACTRLTKEEMLGEVEEEDTVTCTMCREEQAFSEAHMGKLGTHEHFRCRYCGIGWME